MTLMGLNAIKELSNAEQASATAAKVNRETSILATQQPLIQKQINLRSKLLDATGERIIKGETARADNTAAHIIQANKYRKYNEQYYGYNEDEQPSYKDYYFTWKKYGAYSNPEMQTTVDNTLKWRNDNRANWGMAGSAIKGTLDTVANLTNSGVKVAKLFLD